jgi:hypothetical protein
MSSGNMASASLMARAKTVNAEIVASSLNCLDTILRTERNGLCRGRSDAR